MSPFLLLLALPLGFALPFAWNVVRFRRILSAQLEAYRQGDHEGQLQIIEGFRGKDSEPEHYLFLRGATCHELGRLEEAERLIRRSLSMSTDAARLALCRSELGRVLMDQGRHGEADTCFRLSIREAPERSGGPRGIAENLLRQGDPDRQALETARTAVLVERVQKPPAGKLAKESHNLNLGESLGVLAWALAANSAHRSEVESALAEAFASCGETVKPVLAEVHYFASRAYAALGDADKNAHHLRLAAEADPSGAYGRLARTAMETSAS